MSKAIKQKMTNAIHLPKDVIYGVPIVTLTGNMELCIENYRGIIEYTDELIRIQSKIGQIKVHGKKLRIDFYTIYEMQVSGFINSIEYC